MSSFVSHSIAHALQRSPLAVMTLLMFAVHNFPIRICIAFIVNLYAFAAWSSDPLQDEGQNPSLGEEIIFRDAFDKSNEDFLPLGRTPIFSCPPYQPTHGNPTDGRRSNFHTLGPDAVSETKEIHRIGQPELFRVCSYRESHDTVLSSNGRDLVTVYSGGCTDIAVPQLSLKSACSYYGDCDRIRPKTRTCTYRDQRRESSVNAIAINWSAYYDLYPSPDELRGNWLIPSYAGSNTLTPNRATIYMGETLHVYKVCGGPANLLVDDIDQGRIQGCITVGGRKIEATSSNLGGFIGGEYTRLR